MLQKIISISKDYSGTSSKEQEITIYEDKDIQESLYCSDDGNLQNLHDRRMISIISESDIKTNTLGIFQNTSEIENGWKKKNQYVIYTGVPKGLKHYLECSANIFLMSFKNKDDDITHSIYFIYEFYFLFLKFISEC